MEQKQQPKLSSKDIKLILAVVGGLLLVIGGGVLAYRYFAGGKMNAKCSGMCNIGYTCVSGYCTHKCKTDADCPEGWECGKVQVVKTFGVDIKAGKVDMCLRPFIDFNR